MIAADVLVSKSNMLMWFVANERLANAGIKVSSKLVENNTPESNNPNTETCQPQQVASAFE